MNSWERNQNWKDLPEPEVGDTVQLKLVDVFDYVNHDKVTARINALSDYKTRLTLTGGRKLQLIGKQVCLKQDYIQNIIKKTSNA